MSKYVNYCPVCGSEEIEEPEIGFGDRYYCENCGLRNPYNIEIWYTKAHDEDRDVWPWDEQG